MLFYDTFFFSQDAEGQSVIVGVSAWGIHIFHNNRLINKFVWWVRDGHKTCAHARLVRATRVLSVFYPRHSLSHSEMSWWGSYVLKQRVIAGFFIHAEDRIVHWKQFVRKLYYLVTLFCGALQRNARAARAIRMIFPFLMRSLFRAVGVAMATTWYN